MKLLLAALTILLASGCASAPPSPAVPALPAVQAPEYPAWLEMKPGYAETCAKGGGCVPMTQAELQQMTMDILNRALQACRRLPTI